MFHNFPAPHETHACLWYSVGKCCGAKHAMVDKIIQHRKNVISMPDN